MYAVLRYRVAVPGRVYRVDRQCGTGSGKRTFLSRFWRCGTFALTLSTAALAQAPGPGGIAQAPNRPRKPYVLRTGVQEVLLYATVLDRKGKLVTGLSQSAFKVFENGQPVKIVHFSGKDLPVSIALVLDDSGSMARERAAVQAAALDLIKASNPEDETAVTNFADTAYLDQEFTSDVSTLGAALGQSKTVSGGTALFDTVIGAANHLAESAHQSKQVIVVVTDGRDNASAADLPAAIRRVQAANGPVIYTIGLLYDVPGADARKARHDLEALSDETGGIAFFPGSRGEVDRVAAEVARDIRGQYTIAYRPPDTSAKGDYRTIRVQAESPGNGRLGVRTRKGYLRANSPAP